MTPIQQLMLGTGSKNKVFLDDVFSTYVYTGTGSARSINNGINLSGEGGLTWVRERNNVEFHYLTDTVRGFRTTDLNGNTISPRGYSIFSNSTSAQSYYNGITAFNSNGFSLGTDSDFNGNGDQYASWTFRKAPGFFDVVTYTGNGSNQNISHSLGCVPGCIMVKRLDTTKDWCVYHRATGKSQHLELNNTDVAYTSTTRWNQTDPTASVFTVGDSSQTNTNAATYVAYVFAGGESTAATARSVNFASSSHLSIPDHVYPGNSDNNGNWTFWSNPFTIEMWVKCPDDHAGYETLVGQWHGSQKNWSIRYSSVDIGNNWSFFYSTTGSNYITVDGGAKIDDNQWHHIAVVRTGGNPNLFKLYTDGKLTGQSSSHSNTALHNSTADLRIGSDGDGNQFTGSISNLRIIRNIAHYTSDFKVPTAPLTDTGQSGSNVSGTVLLCCNSSSITGSSFTSGTISSSGSNVTANSDSPFDDPAGYVFGESESESVIKTGSYIGNGSTTGPEITLGWEPQWVMVKNSGGTGTWTMFDAMRGIPTDGNDGRLNANATDAEVTSANWLDLTPTGFKLKTAYSDSNSNADSYIYIAIRRSDGYVGKPADAGTDVFAMDVGNGSATIPSHDSGFPVDLAFVKQPAGTTDWDTSARLISGKYIQTSTTAAEATSTGYTFDSNVGWGSATWLSSGVQSWMWKRHAGFDVVCYEGDNVHGRAIPHSLSKPAEMIWIKNRSGEWDWIVGHKGLNGGTNPWEYYLHLNTTGSEGDYKYFNDQAPTSTHFYSFGDEKVNNSGDDYIAMLFASVNGISKVGSFTNSGGTTTVSCGFQPRFIIVKRAASSGNWYVYDTIRGINAGGEPTMNLNDNSTSTTHTADDLDLTSTGFTIPTSSSNIGYSGNHIFYAHA